MVWNGSSDSEGDSLDAASTLLTRGDRGFSPSSTVDVVEDSEDSDGDEVRLTWVKLVVLLVRGIGATTGDAVGEEGDDPFGGLMLVSTSTDCVDRSCESVADVTTYP